MVNVVTICTLCSLSTGLQRGMGPRIVCKCIQQLMRMLPVRQGTLSGQASLCTVMSPERGVRVDCYTKNPAGCCTRFYVDHVWECDAAAVRHVAAALFGASREVPCIMHPVD
jgi:hypothetical protein